MASAESSAEHWFLPDQPITNAARDAFSHADIARNLSEMVREKEPPSIIGLLGPFGVGKSTVVELLGRQLKGAADFAVVRVSAERHSEPTELRRTLIYAVAEALQSDGLKEKKDIDPSLRIIERSHELTTVQLTELPLRRMLKANQATILWSLTTFGIGVVVWFGIVLGIAGLFQHGHYAKALSPEFTVPIGIIFGLLASAVRLFGGAELLSPLRAAALTPDTVTELQPRAEAADEFERVFSSLVLNIKGSRRLIIAVDDVDRLAPERLLETLHAIHSFQRACKAPPPIFIVSCDERIVRDAIAAAQPSLASRQNQLDTAATAYLDRMFLHRQYVVAHPPRDMRGYSRDLLSDGTHTGAAKLGDNLSQVIEVLIHDGVTDPRHAIRLINAFFGDYRLAILREDGVGRRALRPGEVTAFPRVLARVTVLKVDFPATYAAVLSDTDVLYGLDKLAKAEPLSLTEKRLLTPYLSPGRQPTNNDDVAKASAQNALPVANESMEAEAEPLEDVANLLAYLSRTRDWFDEVDSILPFLYIGQDEIDRRLGSGEARRIASMLANAQPDLLMEHIKMLTADDASAGNTSGVDGYIELVTDLLSGLSGIERSNARNTVVKTLSTLPSGQRTRLADHIGRFVTDSGVSITTEELVTAAIAAQNSQSRQTLIASLMAEPEDVDAWNDKSLVLSRHLPELSANGLVEADGIGFVTQAITSAGDKGNLPVLQKWLHAEQAVDGSSTASITGHTLVMAYLKALAAQNAGSAQPANADVEFTLEHLPTDESRRKEIAMFGKDLINNQKLGGAFGRLATAICEDISMLESKDAAGLVDALSRTALIDDGSFDDDIESGTLRRAAVLLGSLCPAAARFESTVASAKVPTLAATVTLTAALVASADTLTQLPVGPPPDIALSADELRGICLGLFGVLVRARADLVAPLTNVLANRWQQESGSVPTSHEWIAPAISTVDTLPEADGDALIAAVIATVQGKARSDAPAVAALPVLRDALETAAGIRAVPALLSTLSGQLNAATPDAAVFGIDLLQLVYETTPSSITSTGTPEAIAALTALAALNQPTVSPDAIRGLTQTRWPNEHANAAISASSQFSGQMSADDLRGLASCIQRARESDEPLQPVVDVLAQRLVEFLSEEATIDQAMAAALWPALSEGQRALAICVFPGLIEEKTQTLTEMDPDEQAAEVERWTRQILARVQTGMSAPGAVDSMTAARTNAAAVADSTGRVIDEWLAGTTSVPVAVWPLFLGSLNEEGQEKVGEQLTAALLAGKDRILRAAETFPYWIAASDQALVLRVLSGASFPDWVRNWVLEERDEEVARAMRPAVDALPPSYRSTVRDRVGRRPRDEARPVWDGLFGDNE